MFLMEFLDRVGNKPKVGGLFHDISVFQDEIKD